VLSLSGHPRHRPPSVIFPATGGKGLDYTSSLSRDRSGLGQVSPAKRGSLVSPRRVVLDFVSLLVAFSLETGGPGNQINALRPPFVWYVYVSRKEKLTIWVRPWKPEFL
jgi:hypothetical protein